MLVDDIAEFSARPGIEATWRRVGSHLSTVLSATASAVGTGVSSAGLTPTAQAAITAASEEMEQWRAAAQTPLDAVLRRPAYRMVHAIEALDR